LLITTQNSTLLKSQRVFWKQFSGADFNDEERTLFRCPLANFATGSGTARANSPLRVPLVFPMNLSELNNLLAAKTGNDPKPSGKGFICRCPAHDDQTASLSISEGSKGLLLKCHAGCTFEAITTKLGVNPAELFYPHVEKIKKANIVATYPYHDASGNLSFEVCRLDPKGFFQRRPDPDKPGKWIRNLKGVESVPYRLPELLTAVKAGNMIFITEGEKDVAALVANGIAATCNAGGAGKWQDDFARYFDGTKAVCVIADKDTPGRKHAATVAANLKAKVQSVKVIELPDVASRPVKDAHDFFEAGGTAEQLRQCADAAKEFELPANAAEPITPNDWFKKKFPGLAEIHGEPVSLQSKGNRIKASDLNESFMAATLGETATPGEPIVYLRGENRFYTYSQKQGIYLLASEEDISARLSNLLLLCARACKEHCDVDALEFGLRDSSALAGAVKRAKSVNVVPDNFFSGGMEEYMPVGNGILRICDRTLLPFSPKHHFRNRLPVNYIPGAKCPIFENVLLGNSLDFDDIGILQRWCGLGLIGRNISQVMLILSGTAGAGKGTFVRILKGIIGEANIGSLRTEQLNQRFEIGRLIDRTLLYGADVPANFLSNENASILKMLTGGDPVTVELKGSMAAPSLTCEFNIIVTSNSRLAVHLEGDVPAWQRRLVIIHYEKPKPANVIPDLDKQILQNEASGVLNWMLDGLYALRAANWQLALSPGQKARVDELLLESDSVNVFFKERCIADSNAGGLTVTDAFAAYSDFCMDRGWTGLNRNLFGRDCLEVAQRIFRVTARHDITSTDGKKNQRGWKGFRLLGANEEKPC
jgi:P4 family phage/plasmid primase-like protien